MGRALSGGERRRVEITRARWPLIPNLSCWMNPLPASTRFRYRHQTHYRASARWRKLGVLITDHNVRGALAVSNGAYIVSGATLCPVRRRNPADEHVSVYILRRLPNSDRVGAMLL